MNGFIMFFINVGEIFCKLTGLDEKPKRPSKVQPRREPMFIRKEPVFVKKNVIQTPTSVINNMIFPATRCRVIGKHRVVPLTENGQELPDLKVIGGVKLGGVNRVRTFGHQGQGESPISYRLEPMSAGR